MTKWNGFLEKMMLSLVFKSKWVELVMNFVKNVSYSVLLNGNLGRIFNPSRGLWQGDPLSPYLFIFCAERFSRLLHIARQKRKLREVRVGRGS